MLYYIDGYNIIFRTLTAGDTLKDRRDLLIKEISDKTELLKLNTVLVFDSQHQSTEATRNHFKNLEIHYTNEGETADDYIVNQIKNAPDKKTITVVTSDLKLAWRIRRENALTLTAEEYLNSLRRRYKNKCEQIREELAAPPPQKIELPKLIPEPTQPKKEFKPKQEANVEYYLEKFGAEEKEQEGKKEGGKRKGGKLNPSPEVKKYESDFDRWLREFQ